MPLGTLNERFKPYLISYASKYKIEMGKYSCADSLTKSIPDITSEETAAFCTASKIYN